jgi:hypothetical protein
MIYRDVSLEGAAQESTTLSWCEKDSEAKWFSDVTSSRIVSLAARWIFASMRNKNVRNDSLYVAY